MTSRVWKICRGLLASGVLITTAPAFAQTPAAKVARLSLEVTRTEDIRAVRRLQTVYAQYSQAGLWIEMASLFSPMGVAIYGADERRGPAAIASYYRAAWGGAREGLAAGQLHTQLVDIPVVNLAADGRTARGRWSQFSMTGQYGATANWACGIIEADYVKEGGIWKIARLHYFPVTAGSYETGWKSVSPTVVTVPHRFTAEQAGVPIPAIPKGMAIPAIKGAPAAALAGLNKRIGRMNAEDTVLNLQNAYGYYVHRKMWDDAAELFADDGVLEEADAGVWVGPKSIRRSYERFGPQGLKRGQLNNRLYFNETVTVSDDGAQARVRGTQFDLLGDYDAGTAAWGLSVFDNRFVRGADGKWRIRELRNFPIMATDYYQGWHKNRLVTAAVTGAAKPDRPVPAADVGALTDGAIPVFLDRNPVTGKPVVMPAGTKTVGGGSLLGAPTGLAKAEGLPGGIEAAIVEARRRLSLSVAYVGADNLSHALGYDIDDQKWRDLGQLMAKDGWRAKLAVAFCIGPEHTEACETSYDGVAAMPRVFSASHWMVQPVIDVAPDGRSARMRNYLIHFNTSADYGVGISDGLYPNNAAKLVDGVWKFDVAAPDQPYLESFSYAAGWSRKTGEPTKIPPIKQHIAPTGNFPPDINRDTLNLRHHGSIPPNDVLRWPDIKPMWFSYKNPVSGRLPPLYCPDLKTCETDLAAAKTR